MEQLNMVSHPKGREDSPFDDAIVLHVRGVDGRWVEGNAGATYDPKLERWSVGIYIWSGNVRQAAKEEIERRTGLRWKWSEYGGGQGREGGYLIRDVYFSDTGIQLYLGWGRPKNLSKQEAEAYSEELKAKGCCGNIRKSKHAGWCVCRRTDPPLGCEEEGYHWDSRHEVIWELL